VVLLAGVALGMPTMAGAPSTNDVLKKWEDANTHCRGGAGKETMAWCAIRDGLGYVLDFRNLCYGKQGQAGFEMQWHRCGRDSIRPEIPESVRYE
jgi:hypothetical protein